MGIEKALYKNPSLKDILGNYSISDLRQLDILQPMFWNSDQPSIITSENLKEIPSDQLKKISTSEISDEDWEKMLRSSPIDFTKLQQIKNSIKSYEKGRR